MSEPLTTTPPIETPILFLAGEWGCTPRWYPGYCWESNVPGQTMKFYVYAWFLGYPATNPPFGSPPYLGKWKELHNVPQQPSGFQDWDRPIFDIRSVE